jgi:hypothetical protein
LQGEAEKIGATDLHRRAAALGRAMREQPDPTELEALWLDLERAFDGLTVENKPPPKPREARPAPPARVPALSPANVSKLRKAVNEILPLLVDQDPGAKDCLKANRGIFRAACTVEAFAELEQTVKDGDLGGALEQLKRAVRKHGISL